MDAAAASLLHAPTGAAAARRSGLSASGFMAPTARAFAIAALSGAVMALTASAAPAPGAPGCDGVGTVHAQHQIGAYVGGFGDGLDAWDLFGSAVANIGDLDGDGITDLAVGAMYDDDGGTNRGAAWILFMNANGAVKSKQKISSTQGGFGSGLANDDRFGNSIAPLGDLDGDGIADLAVGAALDDDGGTNRGAVWILFMNADGMVQAKQKISSTQGGFGSGLANDDRLGDSIAVLGDLDDDGVPDLAVGATGTDDGGTDRGAEWILFMNADGTVKAKQKISSIQGGFGSSLANGDFFGQSVAVLGDLDGDGVPDLAVGAPGSDDGGADRGAVWIVFMNTNGTVKSKQKISSTQGGLGSGLANGDALGRSVALLGDLDGDGVPDLAVGAHGADDGGTDRGAVWILFMNSNGSVKAKQKISQTTGGFSGSLINGGYFGESAVLYDIGQAGRHTIVVGAYATGATLNPGEVWMVTLNTCTMGPSIIAHPESVLLEATGGLASFSVDAEGSGTLAYQWRRNGVPLTDGGAFLGSSTPTLIVSATASAANIGAYDCVVSNAFGSTTSLPAILGIEQSCPGDINGSGGVDGNDLAILLGHWGLCSSR